MNDKEKIKILTKALENIAGCFNAAYFEGLLDKLGDETNIDADSLYGLVTRRLQPAHDFALIALNDVK